MEVEQNKDKGSGTLVGEVVITKEMSVKSNILKIESVAKSLRALYISNAGKGREGSLKDTIIKRNKWTRKKVGRKENQRQANLVDLESGKRQHVEVMITEGTPEECGGGEKKRKQLITPKEPNLTEQKVVLKVTTTYNNEILS